MAPAQRAGRVDWIDAARGIGIVLVVVGHVEGGLVDAGIQAASSWAWPGYVIYCFHMPLFFWLAGLNVPHSLARGTRGFLPGKLWTIAYPYALWSVIQGLVLVAASSVTNGQAHAGDLLAIGWRPMGQFWFLYVLMAYQVLALLLRNRPGLLAGLAVIAFVGGALLPQGGLGERLSHNLLFFAAGVLLSARMLSVRLLPVHALAVRALVPATTTIRDRNLPAWILGGAAGLGLAAALSGPRDGMNFDAPLALPAAVCGIVLTVALAQALRGPALRLAVTLGRMSMTIYVMHVLAAAGTRIVLLKLQVAPSPVLFLFACTLVGVGAPMIVHVVLARADRLSVFGLGPRRARLAADAATQPA
ncbi:MAG: acyltransferase family protein [Janthinobacterium lividum]